MMLTKAASLNTQHIENKIKNDEKSTLQCYISCYIYLVFLKIPWNSCKWIIPVLLMWCAFTSGLIPIVSFHIHKRAGKQPTENVTSSMTQLVCNFYGCHAVWIHP